MRHGQRAIAFFRVFPPYYRGLAVSILTRVIDRLIEAERGIEATLLILYLEKALGVSILKPARKLGETSL